MSEDSQTEWVDKFLEQLVDAIEWLSSPGSISWRFHPEENLLQLAPSLEELVGGADDGESVYPFYSLNVAYLSEIFDDFPEMWWNTMYHELTLEVKIDGDDAWITFSDVPFDDEEAQDVFDPQDGIKPKSPPLQ